MNNENKKIIDKSKLNKKLRNALFLNTNIVITDDKTVLVENCKHILECNDVMVKMISTDFQIEIWGSSLTISDYNTSCAIVHGKISSVNISQRIGKRGKEL